MCCVYGYLEYYNPSKKGVEVLCFLPSAHYPLYDFDLRATHARTLLPAALASVSFGFVLVRVRVQIEHLAFVSKIYHNMVISGVIIFLSVPSWVNRASAYAR